MRRAFTSLFAIALAFAIGSSATTGQTFDKLIVPASEATYILDAPRTEFIFGVSLNTRPFDFAYGDIDDDGLIDRLLVSPNSVDAPLLSGVVYVEFGHQFPGGIARSGTIPKADTIVPPKAFGIATTVAVGDLNLDGIDDVVIGAAASNDDDPGEVSIVYGPIARPAVGRLWLRLSDTPPDASIVSPDASRAFAYWTRIGDITGDGVK